MPTHEEDARFWRDWAALSYPQRLAFLRAVKKFTFDLQTGQGFRQGLRVKLVQGTQGVYEMTWAGDGRATFSYGVPLHPGDPHIIWRRIGTHDILQEP